MAGSGPNRAWLICDDPYHTWLRGSWEHQEIDPRLPMGSPSPKSHSSAPPAG
jgi:5-deoxy-glucuronate isomerase